MVGFVKDNEVDAVFIGEYFEEVGSVIILGVRVLGDDTVLYLPLDNEAPPFAG